MDLILGSAAPKAATNVRLPTRFYRLSALMSAQHLIDFRLAQTSSPPNRADPDGYCERQVFGEPRRLLWQMDKAVLDHRGLRVHAHDLVILCRRGSAEKALHHLREIMGKLKLPVNEEKTRICRVPDGEFDFLGYTFGRMYSPETGKARLGDRPSRRASNAWSKEPTRCPTERVLGRRPQGWWIS